MDQFTSTIASLDRRNVSNKAVIISTVLFVCVMAYSHFIAQQIAINSQAAHIGTQVVSQYLVGFVLMFIAWRLTPSKPDKTLVLVILIAGVFVRLLLIPIDPFTSSDVSRYLFDGRILLTGLDPYIVAHDHPALEDLRTLWQPPIDHLKYPTIYPPLALALYALPASLGPIKALLAWKVLTALASIAVCLIGYSILAKTNKLNALALLALNPLLILEAGEGAHVDVFTTLAIAIAIWAWQTRRIALLGIAIGLGASIKIVPALLLLPLWFFLPELKTRLRLSFFTLISWSLVYAIAIVSGLKPIGILTTFFAKWRSSSPFFHWFEPMLGSDIMLIIVPVLSLCGLSLIAYLSWRTQVEQNRAKQSYTDQKSYQDRTYILLQASLALPFLLSPVVFTWYLMPLALLFSLRPNWFVALWMVSLSMSHEVINKLFTASLWQPADWAINLIGISLISGAAISLWYFSTTKFTVSKTSVEAPRRT